MHQSHHQSHQPQQPQPQTQQIQSHQQNHHTNLNNHPHHHTHHQSVVNQQHHQMHHPQSHPQQQGPPQQQQPQQQTQQQQPHHQQITHHPHHQPQHHHPHPHHHQNMHHHHQQPSSQQQSGSQANQQQHPQQPSLTMQGSMHTASQPPGQHHQISHAHHQHPQHQAQHPHQHAGAHIHHSGQQHPQPQHGPHASQHSQPQSALHHNTGPVQQQRQQHQHAHPHHQPSHPHQSQPQQHQMHPPQHSMQHQPPHQMMFANPNLLYSQMGPFPGGHAPPSFNHNPTIPSHRPDVPGGLNAQPQPASINPNSIPPINQLAPPVISTATTGTTNVHQQSNNGPILDPSMPRIPMNHHQQTYILPHAPHHYAPHPMNMIAMPYPQHLPNQHYISPSPAMMQPRIPVEYQASHIRHTYDPQNHPNIASKVPFSQPPNLGPKPLGSVSAAAGMNTIPSATPVMIKKREKKPALITNPNTGQSFTVDELKRITNKQETATTTVESPSSNTTPLPTTASKQDDTSKYKPSLDSKAKIPITSDPDSKSNAESLDNKMKNLAVDESSSNTAISNQDPSCDTTKSASTREVLSPAITPKPNVPGLTESETATLDEDRSPKASVNGSQKQIDFSTTGDFLKGISVPEQPVESVPLSTESIDEPDRAIAREIKSTIDESNDAVISNKSDSTAMKTDDTTQKDLEQATTEEPRVQEKVENKQLSLPYEPGQYSPQNPSGKRKYSYKFLMAVAESMEAELSPIGPSHFDSPLSRVDFAPAYLNQQPYHYRDAPSSRRSSQQAIARPKRIIPTASLQTEIELKTTENAWKPELEQEKSKAVETGEMDTTRLLKVFRGHLNKLTPQKYDSIIAKVAELDLDGPERLTSVIDLVFDKAVDEPGFCELYAKMCKVIGAKHEKFFYHLVKKCQDGFETSDLYDGLNVEARREEIEKETDVLKKKMMSEELYEEMRLRRKKYLGTIKLIGEMYKFGLLIPKIIGLCMRHLIEEANNENLECLCSLLATVGAKMNNEEDVQIKQSLKNTLQVLHDFAHTKYDQFVLESRIKFKILDTIDLSKHNWRPRMVENNPKKLDEIHQEAKEDKMRQQQQLNHSAQNRNMLKNDDRDRPRRPINNSYAKNR